MLILENDELKYISRKEFLKSQKKLGIAQFIRAGNFSYWDMTKVTESIIRSNQIERFR